MNPYDWRRHRPKAEVRRANVAAVAEDLRRGGSGILLAGRGMGKSVFLRQLQEELERFPENRTFLFSAPPSAVTVQSCMAALARKLDVELDNPLDTHEIVEACLKKDDGPRQIVLLYDEFDSYAGNKGSPAHPSGRDFFNNLEAMRRDFEEVGILAAGSIGVFVFRDIHASTFLARAAPVRIAPFTRSETRQLAQPFTDDGRRLATEVLEAIDLASGGNPALVTYGLESLWPLSVASVRDVAEIYSRFQREQRQFLQDFQLSFDHPDLSEAPARVLALVQEGGGAVPHSALQEACAEAEGALRLNFADVLDLLAAAGLIRLHGAVNANPVLVHPVASILGLPRSSVDPDAGISERLRNDLGLLLGRLHAAGADFYRPWKGGKRLVPESVFAGFLAMGLELLGWQADREAQSGAGRTDVKLRWRDTGEEAVIEVKIWPRNDYRQAHRQVESYWSDKTSAGAVVMIADAALPEWPPQYRQSCLDIPGLEIEEQRHGSSPAQSTFVCRSLTLDGLRAEIDHYLLRIPRGRL